MHFGGQPSDFTGKGIVHKQMDRVQKLSAEC